MFRLGLKSKESPNPQCARLIHGAHHFSRNTQVIACIDRAYNHPSPLYITASIMFSWARYLQKPSGTYRFNRPFEPPRGVFGFTLSYLAYELIGGCF